MGLIYDVALDATAWPQVLTSLGALFNCHFADSFSRRDDYSDFFGIPMGLDQQDYEEEFLGFWVKRNVWGTRRPVRQAGDVVSTRDMTPVDDLRRSEMYNEYLAPRGLHEGLRLDIRADGGWIEDISLLRPWSSGPFAEREVLMAQRLMPHLRRSSSVARRLRMAGQLADAGLAALEELHSAVLLLDRQGRMVHANRPGMQLLADADGLEMSLSGPVAATVPLTNALRGVIDAAAGRHGGTAVSGALRLPRPSGRASLAVVALPLRAHRDMPGLSARDAPTTLVCIADPEAGGALQHARLAALFGLTPSEAALADDLLAGLEVREIAEARGRSVHTVRSHLAQLLAKTETGRQSELVRLLARLPRGGKGR